MNPTPNQITECDDEKQLCDLSFDICYEVHYDQGKDNPNRFDSIRRADGSALFRDDWCPTSPTEKGKAQCWDLMMKFKIKVSPKNMIVGYPTKLGVVHFEYWDGNAQIAVAKAALLCSIGGEL